MTAAHGPSAGFVPLPHERPGCSAGLEVAGQLQTQFPHQSVMLWPVAVVEGAVISVDTREEIEDILLYYYLVPCAQGGWRQL